MTGVYRTLRARVNPGLMVLATIAHALMTSACLGGSPTSPTIQATTATPVAPPVRPTWGISGQSNADFLTPHLAPYADVIGYAESGTSIDAWLPGGSMWVRLAPTLTTPMAAFIWWQGETDLGGALGGWDNPLDMWLPYPGRYQAALTDVMHRVRDTAHQPDLLVVIVRIADTRLDTEQDAFVAADGHALAVQTRDIGFFDGTHMTPENYDRVAQRLAQALGVVASK